MTVPYATPEELATTKFDFGSKQVEFLEKQWQFTWSTAIDLCHRGGLGCLSAESTIEGIPVAEFSGASVPTLFGRAVASRSFLKGQADLYEVRTLSGKTARVTVEHRFLTPTGWCPLGCLRVGSLIAADDRQDVGWERERLTNSTESYYAGSHRYDGLLRPWQVVFEDIVPQRLGREVGDVTVDQYCDLSTESFVDLWASRDASQRPVVLNADVLARGPSQDLDQCQSLFRHEDTVQQDDRSVLLSGSLAPSRYHSALMLAQRYRELFLAQRRQVSVYQDDESIRERQNRESLETSYDRYDTSFWDPIIDIQFVKHGDFYDLTVPVFEHYLSGGLWHHNSAKTLGLIYRATQLSCFHPGNLGIIGRFAATDLAATTRRDCLEFWQEANLLADFKEKRNGVPTAVLYCLDPHTNEKLKRGVSEVMFLHVDDPGHLHGYKVGWFGIDEAQESRKESYVKLVGRTRRPGFEKYFSHCVTANCNGHDWIWDLWCNPERLAKMTKAELHHMQFIRSTTYENKFLPAQYIEDMKRNYSAEDIKRYLEASDDVFEGQIYKEFSYDLHVVPRETFRPEVPKTWDRYLAVDVGGSDPWAWIFAAVDPEGNIIVYDEIYASGTRIAPFVERAQKRLRPELHFRRKIIDYENKLAAGELQEAGIRFDNAKKSNKRESIFRLSGYLHPSGQRQFPKWHSRAGQSGSPRLFITANCRNLIAELPQQKWKQVRGTDSFENVPDQSVPEHACDALLYICRELPKPTELAPSPFAELKNEPTDLLSKVRWAERLEARRRQRVLQAQVSLGACGRGIGRRISLGH